MAFSGDDKTLGPQYNWKVDFTLPFEHIILTILPALALLLCSPLVIRRCLRGLLEPDARGSDLLLIFRLTPVVALVIIEAISAGFWSAVPEDDFRPRPAIASAALSCIAALAIAAIVYIEHRRCLRTSATVSVYLSITFIIDIIKTRTYLSRPNLSGVDRIGALCAAGAVAKLLLAVLEEIPRKSRSGDRQLSDTVGSESLSGFWGRALFIWLNSTFLFGFRNVLSVRDLQNLGPELDAKRLHVQFRKAWDKTDKSSRFCLLKACMGAFWESFMLVPIPRLLFIGFNFAQPFLLHRILVSIRENEEMPVDVQNGLIAATLLVFFGIGLTNASFTHLSYRFITRLRSVFVQEIYNKTLVIPQFEAEQHAAVTLMSTEIDIMILGLAQFHDIWAAFVEIGIGTWLLSTIVGKICYFILPIAVVSTISAYELGRRMGPARRAWNEYIQLRVAKTANVLSQCKPLKMLGLSSTISDYLQRLRVQEIYYTKTFRKLTAIMVGTSMFLTATTPITILAGALFWTTFNRHVSADEVFPMMTVLYLVEEPLDNILNYYPNVVATIACIDRMQKYLLVEEIPYVSAAEASRASRHSAAEEKEGGFIEIAQRRLRAPLPTNDRHVVQFFRVSIAPRRGRRIVLTGVNINIPRYSLTMVTAATGGGKTTLLRAVIGGAYIELGSMHVDPRMGYCAQEPWIQNLTICKCIISHYMFDPIWYDAVVKACMLLADINMLPGGDQYLVGSGGCRLSVGQKHRLALARAVYPRPEVLVLDDVFASLDRATAAAIFCALFGNNGLLNNTNMTVIMATSAPTGYLDLATDVLYIHQDSSVTTHTNNNRPNLNNAALYKLLAQTERPEDEESSSISQIASPTQQNNVELEESEEPPKLKGSKGLYRFYLRSVRPWKIAVFVIMTVLFVVAERLPRIFIRIWIDIDPDNMNYFIAFALLGVANGIIAGLNLFFYWFYFVPESAEGLHRMLADAVMRAKLSFLTTTDGGTILNRFSQDMNLLTQELPVTFWKCFYCFLLLVCDVAVLASGVSYAAASIPFLILIVFYVQKYYLRTSRQLRHMELEAKAPLYTHFTETATGLEHIRCFGWQGKAEARNVELLEYSQKPFYYMYAIQRWLTLVMDMTSLALATAVVIMVLRVKGATTPAGFGLTFLNIISLGTGMTSFIQRWTEMETSLGAIERLRTFLGLAPLEKTKNEGEHVPENWPQRGHIVMNQVCASYSDTDDRHVLHNVSLNFRPGKKAAIIGRTGSGKSTIITTILNFLEYTGSIQIDDVELSRVAPDTLRSRITTVTQEKINLDSTVRDNIIPEEMMLSPDEQTETSTILRALDRVGLLNHFAGRLDSPMTEIGLSVGQQQQFAVARALLHNQRTNSKIVLMDEPTSSMGPAEEAAIQEVMASAFSGCTVVTVTHRVEAVLNRQIVVEMENGRIAGYND